MIMRENASHSSQSCKIGTNQVLLLPSNSWKKQLVLVEEGEPAMLVGYREEIRCHDQVPQNNSDVEGRWIDECSGQAAKTMHSGSRRFCP